MKQLVLVVAAAGLCAGCAAPRYLAKVNGEAITGSDLKREFGKRHRAMERYLAAEAEVRRVLDSVIDRRLFLQEARRAGLHEEAAVREAMGGARDRRLVELLVAREVDRPSEATEAEIEAGYARLGEAGLVREVVTATRAEAEEVRARALAGEDFETLARERSIARSRLNGGLFVLRWGDAEEKREAAGFALRTGDISPVFEVRQGFSVLRLDEKKTVEPPPLATVRARIAAIVKRRKVEERDREFIAALRAKYAAVMAPCDLSLAAVEKARAARVETVCATWKGGSFTLSELAARLPLDRLGAVPPARYDAEVELRAGDVVAERLLLAEALARGLAEDPEVVEFVRAQEDRFLVDLYLDRYVTREVTVTEGEVAEAYRARQAELVVPESRLLAQIVVKGGEALAAAQRRLADGEAFEAVAAELSEDKEQGRKGGLIGWTALQELPKPFGPVFQARRGEVVGPIEVSGGLHLVKVSEIRPARPIERAEAEAKVKEDLLTQRRFERFERFRAELRGAAVVEVSDAGIRRYLTENPLPVIAPPAPGAVPHGSGQGSHGGMGAMPGGHPGGPPPAPYAPPEETAPRGR